MSYRGQKPNDHTAENVWGGLAQREQSSTTAREHACAVSQLIRSWSAHERLDTPPLCWLDTVRGSRSGKGRGKWCPPFIIQPRTCKQITVRNPDLVCVFPSRASRTRPLHSRGYCLLRYDLIYSDATVKNNPKASDKLLIGAGCRSSTSGSDPHPPGGENPGRNFEMRRRGRRPA